MTNIEQRLEDLTKRAEKYSQLLEIDIMDSKVNSSENITLFTEWFLESRDLFSEYFPEQEQNYKDFITFNTSGNGFVLASKFQKLYPIFKILKKKITAGKALEQNSSKEIMKNKGFIIHGHHDTLKNEVARFIEKELKKEAIILHEMVNKGKTIIEKFESNADVDFAVAIWSADDEGKSVKSESLSKRARQNVIFETGYFIGKLGRDKVIILLEHGVEKPSDYDGVVYVSLNGNWKFELQKEINSIYS